MIEDAGDGDEDGCPSNDTFQCSHCRGLFCSTCCRRSTCDPEHVGVKTIGHWYCDAPPCVVACSVLWGTSVDYVLASNARRRGTHRGRLVTRAQLDQLSLFGYAGAQEAAQIALDDAQPRWRVLDARDRCAEILRLP